MEYNQNHKTLVQWAWISDIARTRARVIIDYFEEAKVGEWYIGPELGPALGLTPDRMAALSRPSLSFCARLEAWLAASPQHHFVPVWSPEYPALLKEIPMPPLGLYVQGNVAALQSLQIGIVGSRKPSPLGAALAEDFARALGQAGLTITSGLAVGVDASAHQGALEVSAPTIGVMATGIDEIYPARHRRLAASMVASQGAVITEFPLGTQPTPPLFPQRNRIISGLSQGVLVVEAALRSGTLTTAKHAVEQNREVFAIPGAVRNPQTQGCHYLIKQGATLVETPEDILLELGLLQQNKNNNGKTTGQNRISCSHLDKQDREMVTILEMGVVGVDELISRLNLPAQEVACRLTELELRGLVQTMPGGYTRAWRSAK